MAQICFVFLFGLLTNCEQGACHWIFICFFSSRVAVVAEDESKLHNQNFQFFSPDRSKKMAEDAAAPPPIRLMTFISEDQLDEAKKARGERVDDGTAERDRPLFEILRENKDKRDAEFNERFKHRPPKALDEDETEFLDRLELSRREYERQIADEEAQQLRRFQEAVEARSSAVYELKEVPSAPKVAEELKPIGRKSQPARSLGSINITVKPQAKKAKTERAISGKPLEGLRQSNGNVEKPSANVVIEAAGSLVSYSDESEDEDG